MKILIISGFLGAGKTTFIKEMSRKVQRDFVVMENEYGETNMDSAFLKGQENLNIWELTEGCICCSMKSDFASSVLTIANTLDPEYLYISGPVSQVGQISSVGVEIDVTGVNANMTGSTGLVFYDANGNQLSVSDRITYDVSQIGFEVEILRVRSLPLDFQVTGTAADGYVFAGLTSSVQSLTVAGLKTNLSNLSTITVDDPLLNIQEATQSRTVTIDLSEYVPENVSIVGGISEAEVTLDVEPLETRTFELSLEDVGQTGANEDYAYSFSPETVTVTVQGLGDDLDAMSEEDLNAVLDLTGMTAGTRQGQLDFQVAEGLRVVSVTAFEVTAADRGSQAAAAEETEEEPTEADSESTDHE